MTSSTSPLRARVLRAFALCAALAAGNAWCAPVAVVASFSILGDFVRQLGGERVQLTTLVGPDQDAHAFQPRSADARALGDAQLIVANGLGFDDWVLRLADSVGVGAKVRIASTAVNTLAMDDSEGEDQGEGGGHDHGNHDHEDHDHGGGAGKGAHAIDPHAWQDVGNARRYAANIAAALIAADPAGADIYRANAAAYDLRLRALDEEIRQAFASIAPERRLVVSSHDAFAYFGRAYGLRFLAPVGVSNNAEPSARDVARLIRQLRSAGASAVFIENASDSRLIERIRSESGARIGGTLYSDALSAAAGPAPDYISMMRHNANALRAALSPP